MNIKKLKKFFNYNIFYFLLILLLVISFTFQNIAIAQNTNQQQSNNFTEHFSLVLSLDPEGEAKVNYTFQQGNLLAIVYGKSNLKVIDLDSNSIVYGTSHPGSSIIRPYLLDDYLLYNLCGLGQYEIIRVDLSTEEKESINFPGYFRQVTDDGYLITHYGNIVQLIDLNEGQVLFELEVSKGGKILCIDDVMIFPFVDNRGNPAGYKAMSTNGEVKFTLKESFNKVRIFLPEYRSKISTFPIPILINRNYRNQDKEQWFLEFIDKEGQTIASYSPIDLGIDYSWNRVNSPLWVLDESKDNFLLQISSSRKKGESQTKFYYILTDLSGNVLQAFDETSNCTAAIDSQGNILLHQVGGPSDILNYYQQDGTLIFNKQISWLLEAGAPQRFKFLSKNEILEWKYGRFEKYSLTNGELTGIYPISTYHVYISDTIIYNNKVYFFAKPRPRVEPIITGLNLFSFSAADSGWLDIELVSIRPNAGTTYEVWDSTEVKVKFRTEYGSSFGENLSVNFEKGEVLATNDRSLEYTWHTPTIVSGNQDTAKITVSYGPVRQEFIITIKDPLPTAVFVYEPSPPETGQLICFDGSNSTDIDGEIMSYHWSFVEEAGEGDETAVYEQVCINHIFYTPGEYQVALIVTDDNEQTARISQNIKIAPSITQEPEIIPTIPYPQPNGESIPFLKDPQIASQSTCRGACGGGCPESCISLPDDIIIRVPDPLNDANHYLLTYSGVIECGTHAGCRWHDACFDQCKLYGEHSTTDELHNRCSAAVVYNYGPLDGGSWYRGDGPYDGYFIFFDPDDPDTPIQEETPTQEGPFPGSVHSLAEANYRIDINTASLPGAGTDANVYITLFGNDGSSSAETLLDNSGMNDFEMTMRDTFYVRLKNFEDINRIRLRHDNSFSISGNITLDDLIPGNIFLDDFLPGSISIHDLIPDNITLNDIASGNITLDNLIPGNIFLDDFLPGSISINDIDLGNITLDELIPGSFSLDDIIPSSSYLDELIPGSFSLDDINPGSISIDNLIPGNISLNDINPGNISIDNLIPSRISLNDINLGSISIGDLIPGNISLNDIIRDRISLDDIIPGDFLAGWYVNEVRVINQDTGQLWHFITNRWLAVDEGDGRIDVEFPLSYKDERDYQIDVYTGIGEIDDNIFNVFNTQLDREGTDANIYITLFGSNGFNTGEISLNYLNPNNFEMGVHDTFCYIRTGNVGELNHIALRSDNSGEFSDWYCEKIEVKEIKLTAWDEWLIPLMFSSEPFPPDWDYYTGRKWIIPVNAWLTKRNPIRMCSPQ